MKGARHRKNLFRGLLLANFGANHGHTVHQGVVHSVIGVHAVRHFFFFFVCLFSFLFLFFFFFFLQRTCSGHADLHFSFFFHSIIIINHNSINLISLVNMS